MPEPHSVVCVVDDDPLIRKTIESILVQDNHAVELHESGTGFLDGFRNRAAGVTYSCVLLDVKMPDMSGLDVLNQLDSDDNHPPIIMISGQGDISTAVMAMRAGASDFIEKPFTANQLLSAVEQTIKSAKPAASNQVANPQLASLSSRELEVLELLVSGDANKVIAFKLGISQRTVEVHRARIMDRMEVKTFADLVRKAIAAGL